MAALCFGSQRRMNIGILLLGQVIQKYKARWHYFRQWRKQLRQYCHQQRVLNNQMTVRRFSTRFFAKQGTWLVSLLHVLPKKNVHYQVHFGIYVL